MNLLDQEAILNWYKTFLAARSFNDDVTYFFYWLNVFRHVEETNLNVNNKYLRRLIFTITNSLECKKISRVCDGIRG